jgi:hypothetical protein
MKMLIPVRYLLADDVTLHVHSTNFDIYGGSQLRVLGRYRLQTARQLSHQSYTATRLGIISEDCYENRYWITSFNVC